MNKSEQHAVEFMTKTRIGEPSSILPTKSSYGAMWTNGDKQLRMTFHPSGIYSLSYRSDGSTMNYRGHVSKPLSPTTIKAIKEVSRNNLNLEEEKKTYAKTPGNVVAVSDFSTNEAGDIVIGIIGDDCISIQKEGLKTIVLSLTTFLRMFNKWQDLKQQMEGL